MNQAIIEYYRCPEKLVDIQPTGALSEAPGYFRFGPETICYGNSASGFRSHEVTGSLYDALSDVRATGGSVRLPMDPGEIIENLRGERYANPGDGTRVRLAERPHVRKLYYGLRPFLPVGVRKHLQRVLLSDWNAIPFPRWPVDRTVEQILDRLLALSLKALGIRRMPFVWFWPHGARSCAIMTHDVEHRTGMGFCSQLMDLDDSLAIKSCFGIVPEKRYPVPEAGLDEIRDRGFEISVHDLDHGGRLFSSHNHFLGMVERINSYGKEYGATGFRSGGLYRNQAWYDALEFSYDMSVPSVAHLEPQRGGCCSAMPFFIGKVLELPLTTVEDYSLLHIMGEYSIDLWKEQLATIVANHGLASFIVHPDYIIERRARRVYQALLEYLARMREERGIWIALPREVDRWWRERSQMRIVGDEGTWRIEGPGKERARLAFASVVDDELTFAIEEGNDLVTRPRVPTSESRGSRPALRPESARRHRPCGFGSRSGRRDLELRKVEQEGSGGIGSSLRRHQVVEV